jgi:hypothetical protein
MVRIAAPEMMLVTDVGAQPEDGALADRGSEVPVLRFRWARAKSRAELVKCTKSSGLATAHDQKIGAIYAEGKANATQPHSAERRILSTL